MRNKGCDSLSDIYDKIARLFKKYPEVLFGFSSNFFNDHHSKFKGILGRVL